MAKSHVDEWGDFAGVSANVCLFQTNQNRTNHRQVLWLKLFQSHHCTMLQVCLEFTYLSWKAEGKVGSSRGADSYWCPCRWGTCRVFWRRGKPWESIWYQGVQQAQWHRSPCPWSMCMYLSLRCPSSVNILQFCAAAGAANQGLPSFCQCWCRFSLLRLAV